MKIYDYRGFPNPRRVRIFLAEKGVEILRVHDVKGHAALLCRQHSKTPAWPAPRTAVPS